MPEIAADEIGAAAGRKADVELDRPLGVILRLRDADDEGEEEK
jgi:HAMP domain-containing protein